jgi:tetratricopeptide (TPR) repeat protein
MNFSAIRICALLLPVVFAQGLQAQGLGGWISSGRSGGYNPYHAIENCSATLKAHPDDASAYYNRALAYESTGKYELAMSDFNDAIRLSPKFADAFAGRGELFAYMCDEKKALADYNAALALGGRNSLQKIYLGLAEVYGDQGDLDKCLAYHDRIVQSWPGDFTNYENRGYTYMARNEYGKAIADYSKAMEIYAGYNYPGFATDPVYVGLFVERGEASFRSGAYDKAIADFKRANYGGINAAAWFYATCPDAKFRNSSKAVSLAKKGGDADALAAAYAELDDWSGAIKAEKRVIAKETSEEESMVRISQGVSEARATAVKEGYESGIREYAARLALYEQKKPCRQVKKLDMNYQ